SRVLRRAAPVGNDHPAPDLLLVAGLVALGQLVPRRARVVVALALAAAAAEGVVGRVHRAAADGRADAAMARASRLAERDRVVLRVAHLADGGHAGVGDHADLAGGHLDLGVAAVLRHQLSLRTGGAHHLRAFARVQLDVVDEGTLGDVLEREGVADLDFSVGAGGHNIADLQADRVDDVALLAVGVVQQADARGAVRIVLDRHDLRGDAELLALEVDVAVGALVAAALVADHHGAGVVAAAGADDLGHEALLGGRLGDLREVRGRHAAAGRRVR